MLRIQFLSRLRNTAVCRVVHPLFMVIGVVLCLSAGRELEFATSNISFEPMDIEMDTILIVNPFQAQTPVIRLRKLWSILGAPDNIPSAERKFDSSSSSVAVVGDVITLHDNGFRSAMVPKINGRNIIKVSPPPPSIGIDCHGRMRGREGGRACAKKDSDFLWNYVGRSLSYVCLNS